MDANPDKLFWCDWSDEPLHKCCGSGQSTSVLRFADTTLTKRRVAPHRLAAAASWITLRCEALRVEHELKQEAPNTETSSKTTFYDSPPRTSSLNNEAQLQVVRSANAQV